MTPVEVPALRTELLGQPPNLRDGGVAPDQARPDVPSFVDALGEMVARADARAKHADQLAVAFAEGRSDDVHGTMIAVKQVEIDLRLLSNVRRKVLDAFNELWRMNV